MKIDVKASVADILKQEGVEHVFGHTGGHIMHMWEAANNAGIKIIFNKQEGNAVYMADGFTRVTDIPSVILGTAGPGATNMLTGIATAYLDSIPLVAIGATVATFAFGRNPVQDGSGRGRATEQRLAFKAVCKQAMLAPTPQDVPNMVREAFRIAMSGRPGPVYIEIPSNFWGVEIDYQRIKSSQYKNTSIPKCNLDESKAISKALHSAKKPLIIVGAGAEEKGINDKLEKFLQATQIPFSVSPIAKNYIDEHNPLYLGVMRGIGKTQKVYEYMRKSDFVLFLGDRMQEWEMNWYDDSLIKSAKLAQVDPDPEEIGRVYPVDLSSVGSISSFIDAISHKKHKNASKLKQDVEEINKEYPRENRYKDGKGINPLNLNNIIEEMASKDATIVCDTGYAKSMAILKFRTNHNQKFLVADSNGPMGYSVPAAMGAALATKKEVVCFVGDGGFQMSMNELGTAMNYGLKVIYILQKNKGCASLRNFHTQVYGHHCATNFENPDFVKIAESYGMQGYKVTNSEELHTAFAKAKKDKTSVIIEAEVDQSLMKWE